MTGLSIKIPTGRHPKGGGLFLLSDTDVPSRQPGTPMSTALNAAEDKSTHLEIHDLRH